MASSKPRAVPALLWLVASTPTVLACGSTDGSSSNPEVATMDGGGGSGSPTGTGGDAGSSNPTGGGSGSSSGGSNNGGSNSGGSNSGAGGDLGVGGHDAGNFTDAKADASSKLDAAAGSCAQETTVAACDARTDCHSVFVDPHTCGCAALGCCAHFHACAEGKKANCTGPVGCTIPTPYCEGPYVISYANACYEVCVRATACGQ